MTAVQASSSPRDSLPARKRILIVEDDHATYSALRSILTHYGYEVLLATTVAEADALLDTLPDVMVLDLMLPDGDGASLLRRVRDERLPVRVSVTTGMDDPEHLRQVQRLEPEFLLKKPIDLDQLLRTL